jgi:hypothetical protein
MGKLKSLAAIFSMLLYWSSPVSAVEKSIGPLDLSGYADKEGTISIQYHGNTVDPYFALQALLLAQENGLDISSYSIKWANWLVTKQKPDGTFDRFCRNGPVWAPCKTADADDALMAIWLKYLGTMPVELKNNPIWINSFHQSSANLQHLFQPSRGIYMVSPVYMHGLFMDNLEVLSYLQDGDNPEQVRAANQLTKGIQSAFWNVQNQRFLVSTQFEQKASVTTFYPDQVAQIFPLLFDFKLEHADRKSFYQQWMKKSRATWLAQSRNDFAWGLVAVIAFRQGDRVSASCWLRDSSSARGTSHWIVTDEVAKQILEQHGIQAAAETAECQ